MASRPSLGLVLRVSVVALLLTTAVTAAVATPSSAPAAAHASLAGPFKFSVADVVAGETFTVNVTDAPCEEVTVKFFVDGVLQRTERISVGGTTKFDAPSGTRGQGWTIIVLCDSGTTSSQDGNIG